MNLKTVKLIDKNSGKPIYRIYESFRIFEPINSFLEFSEKLGKAPNTVKSRASDLISWFEFLTSNRLGWKTVDNEVWAGYIHHLRTYSHKTIVNIHSQMRTNATINRHLHSLKCFYDYHQRLNPTIASNLQVLRYAHASRARAVTAAKPRK